MQIVALTAYMEFVFSDQITKNPTHFLSPYDCRFNSGWIHVNVEFSADEQTDGRCELGVFLEDLRRLLLNDEGAENAFK